MKNIYDLELNEIVSVNETTEVIRVPGGWIYSLKDKHPLFISTTNEFKNNTKKLDAAEVIRTIENYYHLPSTIASRPSIKEGNYPIAKQMICIILSKHTSIDQTVIAKMLKYANRSSVTASCIAVSNRLDVSPKIQKQYSDIKIILKIF